MSSAKDNINIPARIVLFILVASSVGGIAAGLFIGMLKLTFKLMAV